MFQHRKDQAWLLISSDNIHITLPLLTSSTSLHTSLQELNEKTENYIHNQKVFFEVKHVVLSFKKSLGRRNLNIHCIKVESKE